MGEKGLGLPIYEIKPKKKEDTISLFFDFIKKIALTKRRERRYNQKNKITGCALRTPEERLPSGDPKEEFGRMVFQKKSSPGDRT